ncbi:MAG: polyprenyl synthetase family protein [Candidatus Brockarchaeota archaeon]|nr:polyprenyl synthetase family protein [Candidatus Brockarchaeota archaeon]
MNWESIIDEYGLLIEKKLEEVFNNVINYADKYHPFISKAYSSLREFSFRKGKRLASCSTLLTYKGYAGVIDERILSVCSGIELYRQSILIHDDLVDMEEMRRGGKTIHRVFAEGFDKRLGEGVAIFLGDIAYSLAVQTIMDSGFPRNKVNDAVRLLSEGYREVNESQILDLLFEYKDVNVEEWRIMASKRAASLFKVTMLMGGILGEAPREDLELLKEAAVRIGYAFDIQDDIIDTFASEEQYGRPPCRDVILGKKPLHIVYTLEAQEPEVRTLKNLKNMNRLSPEDIEKIRKIVRLSGGLDNAKRDLKTYAEEAKRLISKTSMENDVKNFFNHLINYIENSLDWYK